MSMKTSLMVLTAVAVSMSGVHLAGAADKAPAPPAAKSEDKVAKGKAPPANKGGSTEVTLKGELTCAKCGLHESDKCQNVLRVKETGGGKEVKYYLTKNVVSEENHSKVCGGSAPATVTGKVRDDAGKKTLAASAVKFD